MTYTNIVVDAAPSPEVRRTLEAARDIAATFGSKLAVVSYAWPRTSLVKEALGSTISSGQWQTRAMEEALETTRDIYDQVMRAGQVESDWCSGIGEPTGILRDHLLTADLAISGAGEAEALTVVDPTDLAIRSGAPVLRLGRGTSSWRFEQVLVAWKDSREARRAVHDALPMLKRATSVLIVGVGDEAATDRLEALSDHLRRHRVAASHIHLSRTKEGICSQILSRAQTEGSDLLVSGAYGHNRHSERVLGGVTREISLDDRISWFLSH